MAIIAGVTVNWRLSPRVINIPVAETSVTVDDLQDTLLAIEAQETDGILFPHLRNTSGGEALGGGVSVGLTTELQNAVIAFAPRTTSVASGTVTTVNTAGTKLIDSAATFIANSVFPGATVINFIDKSVSSVVSVDSETQLTMSALGNGTDNSWDLNDSYKVWNEIQTEITGGNTVAVNGAGASISPIMPTFGTQVVKTSSSSATLQEQLDVQQMSFNSGVLIDQNNVSGKAKAGTIFPAGTSRQPVLSVADALVVAATTGFNRLCFIGSYIFGNTDVLDGFELLGVSAISANLFTFTAGVSTVDIKLEKCTVSGTFKGRIDAEGVLFGTVVDMDYDSWWLDCWLSGDMSLKGGGSLAVINCGSTFPPGSNARPTLDYAQVSTAKSNFLRWSGNLGFKNITSGNIELNAGTSKIFLESSNTGGTMLIGSEDTVIEDDTPVGGMQVIGDLIRFAVIADAGNTATTFKTNLTSTEPNIYKDSLIQILPATASGTLVGQVKKVSSYNITDKFITLTSALSSVPAVGTKMKILNE